MMNYKALSDNELLQLLRESDHGAFTTIYHRYFNVLYIHACKKLQDEDQAKDVVQEVFTTLWIKRDFDLQVKNLAAYLFTATRNRIFDLYAHEQVKTRHLDSLKDYLSRNTSPPTDHRVRENELKAYIKQEILALPPKMRCIFEMSRLQDLSYKEIAEELETTENNVSKQVNNALKVLRTKLGVLLFFFF